MDLLLVTNLYPPQELGGYGRSMADFAWGLIQLGHRVQVLTSDAPYLGASSDGPSGEVVDRRLRLKGSFAGGLQLQQDPTVCQNINHHNQRLLEQTISAHRWDGVLLGNVDLLGPEILAPLLAPGFPVVHHIGFVAPPFAAGQWPQASHYRLVAASGAVRSSLVEAGLPVASAPVVYPGARVELFGPQATGRTLPTPLCTTPLCTTPLGNTPQGNRAIENTAELPLGSRSNPFKVCFAGLLMSSKGAHTLVEALIHLHQKGFHLQANLAGADFQAGYREQLNQWLEQTGLAGNVRFVGQLNRSQLARFFCLHHACVFPSIYPEAFGIVGAEAMASGLVLISSGAGGAGELIDDGVSGLRFTPGDAGHLASVLETLLVKPHLLQQLSRKGAERARTTFSVMRSATQLEQLLAISPNGAQTGASINAAMAGKVWL